MILTVSQITASLKQLIEENFDSVSIIGEISNFKAHYSGHWYFTLKDQDAAISCTMWKGVNNYVFFTPQDGMKVIVNGRLTVYPPRGSYQIDVKSMKPAGEGELQAAFERLKQKLKDEGLFDDQYKKPLPQMPARIGIVTAIGGAALKDMISVAARRFPLAELVIAPSKVQGEGAAQEIAEALKRLNAGLDIDVIIIARGGGSIEDLWAFNEEVVARSVFSSKIPVISGVGHEIDFTIADFVADLRAPTPTAAMELVTPDINELFAFIGDFSYNSSAKILGKIEKYRQEVAYVSNSYGFRFPQSLIGNKTQLLDNTFFRIQTLVEKQLTGKQNRLELIKSSLESYNIDKILAKGFALVKQQGKYVTKALNFKPQENFSLKFIDNEVVVKKDE